MLTTSLLLLGALMFRPHDAAAQNVTLDEGTFSVSMAGGVTGTESFTIRRAGSDSDARVIAQARIRFSVDGGTRDVVPLLEARGLALSLYAYQVEVSGDRAEELYLRADGRRFVANVRSDAGEQQREYRSRPGSLILEEAVAHQYYLLGPAVMAEMPALPVLTPLAGSLTTFEVSSEPGQVRIGGQTLEAQHVTLTAGDERRDVWLDDRGRVLRVEVPSLEYVAVRQEAPRG